MISEAQISQTISAIIAREGGYNDDTTDRGGITSAGGVTEPFAQTWQIPWPPTLQQVHDGYRRMLAGTKLDQVPDYATLDLLADCAINHGSGQAIKWLQQAMIGMAADGIIGPLTIIAMQDHERLGLFGQIHARILASRFKFYAAICKNDPSQLRFLGGWISRACEFLA